MPADAHRAQAAQRGPVPVAIVTVSDTRTADTDVSGQLMRTLIEAAGHSLAGYRIVPDEPEAVARILDELAAGPAKAILFNGGTGIGRRDRTFDVLSRMLERELPGFGELFRMLSFAEVGAAAMLSRATAGVFGGAVVFSLPGSPDAVRLGMERLILPELAHLAWELVR